MKRLGGKEFGLLATSALFLAACEVAPILPPSKGKVESTYADDDKIHLPYVARETSLNSSLLPTPEPTLAASQEIAAEEKLSPTEEATLARVQELFPYLDSKLINFRNQQFNQALETIQAREDLPYPLYPDEHPGVPAFNRAYQRLIENPEVNTKFDRDPTLEQVRFAILSTLPDLRSIPETDRDPTWVSNMAIVFANAINQSNYGTTVVKLENGEPVLTGQNLIDFNTSHSPTRNFIADLILASGYYEGNPQVEIDLDTSEQQPDFSDFGGLLLQQVQGRADLVYRKPETGQVHTNTPAIDGILPNLHEYVQTDVLPRIKVSPTP